MTFMEENNMADKVKDVIVTAPFRLAFPEVFKARAFEAGGREKFAITMLFPKTGDPLIPSLPGGAAGLLEIRKLVYRAIVAKWGKETEKWPTNLRALDVRTALSLTGKDGWPLRDGDEASIEWEGFAGNVFVRASSQFAPGIVDAQRNPVLDQGKVFGGLICRAEVNAFAYEQRGNRGVTLGLNHLQILKNDGTVYGGRTDPSKSFDAVALVEDGVPEGAGFGDDIPF